MEKLEDYKILRNIHSVDYLDCYLCDLQRECQFNPCPLPAGFYFKKKKL